MTFKGIQAGSGREKDGFKKITFYRDQARLSDLHYFWVDSYYIDKSNKVEESKAIRSMFNWYRNASRCYVYLSDVTAELGQDAEQRHGVWEPALRQSDWFDRGWTLQEMLAPPSVEFFSKEGRRLGCKSSLRQVIYEITNIPL